MRITRETLTRIARETVQKRVYSDPELVAAYLTGSLLTENPFLGNTADIDLVFVHPKAPPVEREIVAVTPEIHLDIVHNPRSAYDSPRDLRVHPWLGPELYDPLPLHVTQHFFEFVQAGVRDKYHEPASVLARSQRLATLARQAWSDLQLSQASGPELLMGYLKVVYLAANAIALLGGGPLAERRFLLQFPARAEAAGVPDLAEALSGLLGAERPGADRMGVFLPQWEQAFIEAADRPRVHASVAAPRLGYYKLAFEAMLAGGTPQAVIWPMLLTWTLAASVLPTMWKVHWRSACEMLGLDDGSFDGRLAGLDTFLDEIEDLLEKTTASQGL